MFVNSGTVLRRWRPLVAGQRIDIELAVQANHVEVCNDQRGAQLVTNEMSDQFASFWKAHATNPLSARNKILASFAPHVSPQNPQTKKEFPPKID